METAVWREPTDALTDALHSLRLAECFYARSDLSSPWGLAFTAADGPSFHMVVAGRCWLRLSNDHIQLDAGDLVVLPHGCDHRVGDSPDGPAVTLADLPSQRLSANVVTLRYGGDGERTLMICGGMRFAGPTPHPLVQSLPERLTLRRPVGDGWLAATFGLLSLEALAPQPGAAAVMTRLVDVLALQAVRAWLRDEVDRRQGWLAALADPEIGRALALIHQWPTEGTREAHEPAGRWTTGSLAAAVYLSRSNFSARFTRLVGLPPMRYLAQWRMRQADEWLRANRLSVSEVAHRLGYHSEAAFSRAFKRHTQQNPGAARRQIPL